MIIHFNVQLQRTTHIFTLSFNVKVVRLVINVILYKHENINVNTLELNVKVYVDIGSYWPEDLSINAAYEELLMQGVKVDRRTLAAAKAGKLTKSDFATLIKLRDWVRQLTSNKELKIDDLMKQEE